MKQRLKQIMALALTVALAAPVSNVPVQAATGRNTIFTEEETIQVSNLGEERSTLFNSGWKFFLGASSSAYEVDFNDADWRRLDLPHDYSVEQEFTTKGEAESGFLLGGTGWYRKSFTIPEECAEKTIEIDFNGVYMNATVYVNGQKLGTHPYGYTGFAFDISDYLICDGSTQNVIAVKVDHKTPSSRWYSGSGIYRDVYLKVMDNVHIARYGTTVTTPDLETQKNGNVDVKIATTVENETSADAAVTVKNTVYDASGTAVSTSVSSEVTVPASSSADIEQTAMVSNPTLWSVDDPVLYRTVTEIVQNGSVIDSYETDFGFRYFKMERTTGFSLNGKNMKLKGVCMHHDQGSLGAKAYEDAIERQVKMLKEMGCNSIRVTHNPASDVLVDLCNRYGILLIDEAFDTWSQSKNDNVNDYGKHFLENIEDDNQIIGGNRLMTWAEYDLKEMVARGKNAPSIIMWSLGNELLEGVKNTSDGNYRTYARNLIRWGKEIDDTRPYTFGDNKIKANNQVMIDIGKIFTEEGGIVGLNYSGYGQYNSLYTQYSNWILYGAETVSAIGTRGAYYTKSQDNTRNELTAYDKTHVSWGDTASGGWYDVIRNDFIAGEYVWTGFDYLGEPTPWNGTRAGSVTNKGALPRSSYFGIIDTAGFPKDDYYLYQSVWNDDVNTLHVLPTWDRDNISLSNGNAEVVVYTDAAVVELYLNDAKVGTATSTEHTTDAGYKYRLWQNKTDKTGLYPTFSIPYSEGTLTAKAFDNNGQEITNTIGRNSVATSGTPSKLVMENNYSYGDYSTIDADGYSLSYISVDVTDQNGIMDSNGEQAITFQLEGNGELIGTDNGDTRDTTCFVPSSPTQTVRKAYYGKALAIVKSTSKAGSFTLTASADGLKSDSVTVQTKEIPGAALTGITSYRMPKHCYIGAGADSVELPKTLSASYADGTEVGDIKIQWEDYDKSLLNEIGKFKIRGTIQNGEDVIGVSITVHVAGNIVGGLNYSGITPKGIVPALPNMVQTILDTGNTYEEFPAKWDLQSITADDFSVEGDIVTISGTVEALNKTYPISASIRVAEPIYGDSSNIAPDYLDLTESCTNPSDNLLSIADGQKYCHPDTPALRWTNYNTMGIADTPEITFTWATAHLVDQINLYYYKDKNANSQLPTSVTFQYSIDGQTWQNIGYETTVEEIPDQIDSSLQDKDKIENGRIYRLEKSINPIAIRILLGHDQGKFIGLSEAEIMSVGISYEPKASADLSEIEIDGKPLADFDPSKTEYTLVGNAVTKAVGKDNAAVTVVPKHKGIVQILTQSEDQSAAKVYTINLKRPAADYPKTVSLSAPGAEFKKGDKVKLSVNVRNQDDVDVTDESDITYKVTSGPASCNTNGLLSFTGSGKVTVVADVIFNGKEASSSPLVIDVKDHDNPDTDYVKEVTLKASKTQAVKTEKVQLTVNAWNQNGVDITGKTKIEYKVSGPAACSATGLLSFTGTGKVSVNANAILNGKTVSSPTVVIAVNEPKTKLARPTIKSVSSSLTANGPKVKITVNNKVKNATAYTVYRKVGSKLTKIGRTNKKGIVYDAKPLATGKKAQYYAIASGNSSKYLDSDKSALKSITLPKATAKVKAVKKGKTISISWSAVKKAKGYVIFRSTKKDSGYKRIGTVNKGKSFVDKKAKRNKTYYYAVSTIASGKKYSGIKVSNKIKFK